jgi:hypothetical protein
VEKGVAGEDHQPSMPKRILAMLDLSKFAWTLEAGNSHISFSRAEQRSPRLNNAASTVAGTTIFARRELLAG